MRFGAVFQNCLIQLQQAWEDGGHEAVAEASANFASQIVSFDQPDVVSLLENLSEQSRQGNIDETNLAMESFLMSAKHVLLSGNGIEDVKETCQQEPSDNLDSDDLEKCCTSDAEKLGPPIRSTLPMSQPEFRQIVVDFLPLVKERIEQMRNAISIDDHKQLNADAHWLKGAGGTCGFQEFYEPAFELEKAAKSRQTEMYVEMVNHLEALVNRIELPKLEEIQ